MICTSIKKASTGLAWAQGDFDGDGTVNISDLSNVLTNYDKSSGASAGGIAAAAEAKRAAAPRMKITRIRCYEPPRMRPSFNQSDRIVVVETDAGISGIGEGGAKDTLQQCAAARSSGSA